MHLGLARGSRKNYARDIAQSLPGLERGLEFEEPETFANPRRVLYAEWIVDAATEHLHPAA